MADDKHIEPDDTDEPAEFDDDELASLLANHNDEENVERMADLIATFYKRLRKMIDPFMAQTGEIHDPALEITREWMTYTLGGDE